MKYRQRHPEERVIASHRVIHLFVFGFPPSFAQNPFFPFLTLSGTLAYP